MSSFAEDFFHSLRAVSNAEASKPQPGASPGARSDRPVTPIGVTTDVMRWLALLLVIVASDASAPLAHEPPDVAAIAGRAIAQIRSQASRPEEGGP